MKSESVHLGMQQTVARAPQFTQLLSATRRGARLGRLLAVEQLVAWGWFRDDEATHSASLVVAELASNAVRHGRLEGRGFRLALVRLPSGGIRIEVTDPRGERLPVRSGDGLGMLVVDELAADWGVRPFPPSGKTVWAEISVGGP
ncbi:ATP-binding protein [Streptomyces sp. NPDC001822]|uniref:ATP-binding protein n=1 Tax=Streptomyces sp. NPDC001822 TaxID=3364614 RepID=UPI00367F4774